MVSPSHSPTVHGATHAPSVHGEHGHESSSHSGGHGSGPTIGQLAVLFVSFGLFIGALTRWTQARFKISFPYTVVLLIIGLFLAVIPSESLGNLGAAVHTISLIDPHLLLGVFIPPLIFESAFAADYHVMQHEFAQAVLLAGPGVLINTFLTATLARYMFNYGWTWSEALMFGAIASATDPVAVVALLRELGASKRLATLIEGESLLNDGTAFVIYTIMVKFVSGETPSGLDVFSSFVTLTLGGVFLGIVFGFGIAFWLRYTFNDAKTEITITLFTCYLCFHVAENESHASGVLAVVFLGLVCSKYNTAVSPMVEASLHHVWEILSYSANTLIFLLSGIIIAKTVQSDGAYRASDFGFLVAIYVGIHVTRAATLVILWPFLARWGYGLDVKQAAILMYGGLRGAIGLALALITHLDTLGETTPHKEQFRDLVMFHISGIVFLTLIVNATTIKYLVSWLGLDKLDDNAARVLTDAMRHLRAHTEVEMHALKSDYQYSGSDWDAVKRALPNYSKIVRPVIRSKTLYGSVSTMMRRVLFCWSDEGLAFRIWLRTLCYRQQVSMDYSYTFTSTRRAPYEVDEAVEMDLTSAEPIGRESGQPRHSRTKPRKSGARFGLDNESKFDLREWMTQRGSYPRLSSIDMSDQYDADTLRVQFHHRALFVMKRSYMEQYEHGIISQRAVMSLTEAVETGLDLDDLQPHLAKVKSSFQISWWLKKWFELGWFQRYSRRLLFDSLSLALEVGTQFLIATDKVITLMKEYTEFVEYSVCNEMIETLEKHREEIKELWLVDIQTSYPELVRAIQTRHAAQHIIRSEGSFIGAMRNDGVVDESEYDRMMHVLLEAEHKLSSKSFFDVSTSEHNERQVLMNLSFLTDTHPPRSLRKFVCKHAEKRFSQRKDRLYSKGDVATGILVIYKGVAQLMNAGDVLETLTPGRILAYEFMAGREFITSCVAKTTVEYFYLDSRIMQELRKYPEIVASIWRQCGFFLIRAFFKALFAGQRRIEISRMCTLAQVVDIGEGGQQQLTSPTLLLLGTSHYPLVQDTKQAPAVLLPSVMPYQFEAGAKLLTFDAGQLEQAPSGASPKRRGSVAPQSSLRRGSFLRGRRVSTTSLDDPRQMAAAPRFQRSASLQIEDNKLFHDKAADVFNLASRDPSQNEMLEAFKKLYHMKSKLGALNSAQNSDDSISVDSIPESESEVPLQSTPNKDSSPRISRKPSLSRSKVKSIRDVVESEGHEGSTTTIEINGQEDSRSPRASLVHVIPRDEK